LNKVHGKLVSWDDNRGFGFVQVSKAVPDVFVHISEFDNRARKPVVGDTIRFTLVKDAEGRMQASKIAFKGEPSKRANKVRKGRKPSKRKLSYAIAVACFYFLALIAAIIFWHQTIYILVGHTVFSFLAFSAYAKDKYQAENNRWRVKESTLHFFALFGGWPGALIAQQKLRHKTSKLSFQSTFWLCVLLSLGATSYLHTDKGSQLLSTINIPKIETPTLMKSKPQIEWSDKAND
jgi:uncharacterized membrane protein YsdA (DUF1294 family)/cold shock CspA family protein